MIFVCDFAKRHFNPGFGGTKILDCSPEQFESALNALTPVSEANGYAPFCKHLFLENFTDALDGVAEVTPENEHLLRTGYEARRPEELPVLVRWFDAKDVTAGKASFLDVVLYTRAHLVEKEGMQIPEGVEWVVISINSAPTPEEAPMNPMTILRNALPLAEGGSGVPLDRDAYMGAVGYWSKWAAVK